MANNIKAFDLSQTNPKLSSPHEKMKAMDWIALLHYDGQTGTLDVNSKEIIKDPGTVRRLVENHLIDSDGKLTPTAWQKCAELSWKLKNLKKGNGSRCAKNSGGKKHKGASTSLKMRSSDWSALISYDRDTGNLLRIDPHTGQLDRHTKALLRNNGVIERLMGNGLILPGGWLTPEAKKQCARLEKRIRRRHMGKPSNPIKKNNGNNFSQTEFFSEVFKNMDWLALLKEYGRAPADYPGLPGAGPVEFSLRDVFSLIFKNKAIILVFFTAVFLTGVIYSFTANPTYEATAQILVKLGRESIFVPAAGNLGPVINFDREERINSEIEIIKSRSLAEKVVATIGPTVVYQDLKDEKSGILSHILPTAADKISPSEKTALKFESAVATFQKAIAVNGIKKSNVIQVGFQHEEPIMAAMVVNNLADIYLDHHLAVHKSPQNVKFFQEQSLLLKNKLEQSEEKLKFLKKQHSITSLDEERTLLLRDAAALRAELNRTLSQEIETEKRILQLRAQLAATPKTISQAEETDQNPYLINTLETRLVELELSEKQLLAKYTKNSRLVQNVKNEIKVVKQKLAEQEKKRYGRKLFGLNTTHQRLQETLFQNEAELNALKAKAQTQQFQLAEYQRKLEALNQVEIKLNQLVQQVDVDRQNYRLYLTKYEESRISDAMDTEKIASVSLIQPAHIPLKPVSPKKMLNILIAITLGAFGGLALASLLEYLDDKLETIEDIEETLQLPVLASIPEFDHNRNESRPSLFDLVNNIYRQAVEKARQVTRAVLSRREKAGL